MTLILLIFPIQVKGAADNGELFVMTENSDFSFNVYIYQNPENDGYVYYLDDKYIDEKKGPFKSDALADVLDERQIGSYVIDRIDEKSKDSVLREQVKNLPDSDLTNVLLKLVKNGKERNYSIQSDTRVVLNNFTSCLIASNQEGDKVYSTMYDKVKALSNYLKQESHVEPIIKKLYNQGLEFSVAEAPTLLELIKA